MSAVLAWALATSARADELALWTFETSAPTTAGPVASEFGAGAASGFHSAGATTYASPSGNGSAHSYLSDNWHVADYFQFLVDSTGYRDLQVSWDQAGNATGPRDFKLQVSSDGTTFADVANYTVALDTWTTGSSSGGFGHSYDLSSFAALNNVASVFLRLTTTSKTALDGRTLADNGNSRVDNFRVAASPLIAVPEPWNLVTAALSIAIGLAAVWRQARRAGSSALG